MARIAAPNAKPANPSLNNRSKLDEAARQPVYTAKTTVLYVTCGRWPWVISLMSALAMNDPNRSAITMAAADIQSLSITSPGF